MTAERCASSSERRRRTTATCSGGSSKEREGRLTREIDVERLSARLQSPPHRQPAEGSGASVVLLDAGPQAAELMKVIRRVSGLGL